VKKTRRGHPIIPRFEPGKDWFYDYEKRGMIKGVESLPPHSHPGDQPSAGRQEEFQPIGNRCSLAGVDRDSGHRICNKHHIERSHQ